MVTKLQLVRESQGISIDEAARKSGVSKGTIQRIENVNDTRKTNVDIASALANGLDVRLDDLFDDWDLTNVGRPAHTGRPITHKIRRDEVQCPHCFVLYSPNIGCENCGTDTPALRTA